MSRKHYKLIAEELNAALELNKHNFDARQAVERVIEGLATLLQKDNPRFKRQKFLDACGLDKN